MSYEDDRYRGDRRRYRNEDRDWDEREGASVRRYDTSDFGRQEERYTNTSRYGREAERGGSDYGRSSRERDYGRDMMEDMGRYSRRELGQSGRDVERGPGSRSGYGYGDRSDYDQRNRSSGSYYSGGGTGVDYSRGDRNERGFFERAGDEIATWFGDDDAERRREQDARRGDSGAQHHRGRGPRNYTRSDERIRDDVNDRLTDDPYLDASDIEVTVSSGEVTLNGTVDDRGSKRRAEDLADGVSGVRHVQNNLRVGRQGMTGQEGSGAMGTSGRTTTVGSTTQSGAATGTFGLGETIGATGSSAGTRSDTDKNSGI